MPRLLIINPAIDSDVPRKSDRCVDCGRVAYRAFGLLWVRKADTTVCWPKAPCDECAHCQTRHYTDEVMAVFAEAVERLNLAEQGLIGKES